MYLLLIVFRDYLEMVSPLEVCCSWIVDAFPREECEERRLSLESLRLLGLAARFRLTRTWAVAGLSWESSLNEL